MKTKTCNNCKQELSVDLFWKKGNRLQSNCKPCQSKINKERYQKNRKHHIKRTAQNNRKRVERYLKWKSQLECCVCGEDYGGCLEMHHLDPTEKEFTLSYLACTFGSERFIKELHKCVVVCRNCHTKIHDEVILLTEDHIDASLVQIDDALNNLGS